MQVLIFVAMLVIVATLVSVAVYEAQIPLDLMLGSIVEQRIVSNALGGVYFGTQVIKLKLSNRFFFWINQQYHIYDLLP